MPGLICIRPGGVALNIASALTGHNLRPALLATIGSDREGAALVAWLRAEGILTEYLHRPVDQATDSYMAIEGPEGLFAAIADSRLLEDHSAALLAPLATSDLRDWRGPIVLDSGLAPQTLAGIAQHGIAQASPLRLTCAAPRKAHRLRPFLQAGAWFTLNRAEAEALLATPLPDSKSAATALIAAGAARAIVTDGPYPATDADGAEVVSLAPPRVRVEHVTGAGDHFLAAHIAAELQGLDRHSALTKALAAAAEHIATPHA